MIKEDNTFLRIVINKELYEILRTKAKNNKTSISKYALSLIKKALLNEL